MSARHHRSRGIVLVLVGAVFLGLAVVTPVGAEPGPLPDQTWIVTMIDRADPSTAGPRLVAEHGGRLLHTYSHALHGFSFAGSAAAAQALSHNPVVTGVEADRPVHAVEILPYGIGRIDGWSAHQAGYSGRTSTGAPVRIAVVDTGIDLNHIDLAANLANGEGTNCINPGQPPNDDHGHGTHVAGTAAAAFNAQGVVGVATDARLVPVKVLDSTGYGSDAQVICGLDYIATLPGPMVVNMSLGDSNRAGETACDASALHRAICNLTSRGITVVAAAGNDGTDATGFVPAAWDEVVAVSAFTDFDGQRSSAGCQLDFSDYGYQCDDMLADFSNYGSVVDVTAPGVHIYSTWNDGGWQTLSGTSMAAPHVAGTAALVLGANPALTPAQVRSILQQTGECPDGTRANAATCAGHGQWQVGSMFGNYPDPDGIAEPLVNALRAAQAATASAPPPGPDTTAPSVSFTAPAASAAVRGTVAVSANASDNVGVARVDFFDGSTPIGSDTTAPYSVTWATSVDGPHTLTTTAFDAAGLSSSATRSVIVDNTAPQVSVTNPIVGTVSGTITIAADATDPTPASGIAKVDFLVDGAVVGTDATAPYTASWNSTTAANGSHAITARATDAAGNANTSPPININVSNSAATIVTHITYITAYNQLGPRSWKTWVEVGVADQGGRAVAGATVTFAVSGGATTTLSCTTGSNGVCSTSKSKLTIPNSAPSVTYTTRGVTKTGTAWDGVAVTATVAR